MTKSFQAVPIPPEILEIGDHCEIDLGCTHEPYAMIITEKDSFYVCKCHYDRMNQINKLIPYLEN